MVSSFAIHDLASPMLDRGLDKAIRISRLAHGGSSDIEQRPSNRSSVSESFDGACYLGSLPSLYEGTERASGHESSGSHPVSHQKRPLDVENQAALPLPRRMKYSHRSTTEQPAATSTDVKMVISPDPGSPSASLYGALDGSVDQGIMLRYTSYQVRGPKSQTFQCSGTEVKLVSKFNVAVKAREGTDEERAESFYRVC